MDENEFIKIESNIQECCFISIPKKDRRAVWELTHYCPHNCQYCFTSSSTQLDLNKDFLTKNRIKILNNLEGLNTKDLLLTGGEPLSLGEGIIDIIKMLDKKDITYSVSTTCTPKKYFIEICNLNPRRINLSYDPKQNDGSISLKSNIKTLKHNLDILSQKKISVKLNAVITKFNFYNLSEFCKSLNNIVSDYDIIEKIALAYEYPIGRGIYQKGLTLEELKNCYEILESDFVDSINNILVNWPSFNEELQYCPAGKSIFSVMPNGDIAPCSLLYYMSRSFKTGNIINNNVNEITKLLCNFHKGVRQHIREFKSSNDICIKCENNKKCGGGCFAMMPVLMIDHREKFICKFQPKIITDEQKQFFAEVQKPFKEDYLVPKSSGIIDRLNPKLEREIKKHVKKIASKADLAHNFEHIETVVRIAKDIVKTEKANEKIVLISCYFHDASLRNASMHHFHTINAARAAEEFLSQNSDLSKDEILHIKRCIISSSHGSYLLGTEPRTIEAEIVRDADLLDAIGARGIARVFAFAAAHGIKEFGEVKFDPESFPFIFEMNLTGPDKSPIHHFYTKLLKLKALIQTPRGKELAIERHQIMVDFLRKYAKEVNFKSNNFLQSVIDNWSRNDNIN